MSFLRKLGNVARGFVEMFPPEAEREPTIAEDYPEKWEEVQQRSRRIDILFWVYGGALSLIILCGIYGNFVGQLSDEQRRFAVNAIFVLTITFSASNTYLNWFRCPRCQKTFQYPMTRAIFHRTTRCQHCGLKMGEAPKLTSK